MTEADYIFLEAPTRPCSFRLSQALAVVLNADVLNTGPSWLWWVILLVQQSVQKLLECRVHDVSPGT